MCRVGILANTIKFDIIISFAITQHNDVRNDQIKKYNTTRIERSNQFFNPAATKPYIPTICQFVRLIYVCVCKHDDDDLIRQQVAERSIRPSLYAIYNNIIFLRGSVGGNAAAGTILVMN